MLPELLGKLMTCACFRLSCTYLLRSLIRSSSLFEWDQALCDLCWLLLTALSKSSLFMFNQEDQLPAHSIITPLESSQSYLQKGSAESRALDRQSSAISVNSGCTLTQLLPSYWWFCAGLFLECCASCISNYTRGKLLPHFFSAMWSKIVTTHLQIFLIWHGPAQTRLRLTWHRLVARSDRHHCPELQHLQSVWLAVLERTSQTATHSHEYPAR